VDRKHPRLRQEHLARYAGHLIGLSSGPRGEVERACAPGAGQALAAARHYAELLGPGNFYLELQHHCQAPERAAPRYRLRALAEELGLPVVATNDVHYVTPTTRRCRTRCSASAGISLDDRPPGRKPNAEFYLKSAAQMRALSRTSPRH